MATTRPVFNVKFDSFDLHISMSDDHKIDDGSIIFHAEFKTNLQWALILHDRAQRVDNDRVERVGVAWIGKPLKGEAKGGLWLWSCKCCIWFHGHVINDDSINICLGLMTPYMKVIKSVWNYLIIRVSRHRWRFFFTMLEGDGHCPRHVYVCHLPNTLQGFWPLCKELDPMLCPIRNTKSHPAAFETYYTIFYFFNDHLIYIVSKFV